MHTLTPNHGIRGTDAYLLVWLLQLTLPENTSGVVLRVCKCAMELTGGSQQSKCTRHDRHCLQRAGQRPDSLPNADHAPSSGSHRRAQSATSCSSVVLATCSTHCPQVHVCSLLARRSCLQRLVASSSSSSLVGNILVKLPVVLFLHCLFSKT